MAGSGTAAETNGVGQLAAFDGPLGISQLNGGLYVTDFWGNTVRKVGMQAVSFSCILRI